MSAQDKDVLVPLADGFEEIEAITIINLLRRAGITVTLATITDKLEVYGSHNICVKAEQKISAVIDRRFDGIILPGGMPGTKNLSQSKELSQMISRQWERGEILAAICAAPTVLAQCGVLKGKEATSYPEFQSQLSGAKVSQKPVVEDGNVVTSQGPGTAILFSLKMIEKLVGSEKRAQIEKAILFLGPS